MRSNQGDLEDERIKALEAERKKLQEDLCAVERELNHLSLSKEKKGSIPLPPTKLFPLGSKVIVVNKRDPAGLFNRTATVTGHTKARVKVTVGSVEYSRATSSLKLVR